MGKGTERVGGEMSFGENARGTTEDQEAEQMPEGSG